MKEIAAIIILFVIIKLTSYGVWNVKKDKNILGAVGVGILDVGIIFMMGSLIMKIFK